MGKGRYQTQIANDLKTSKQNIYKCRIRAVSSGLVEVAGYGAYLQLELTPKGLHFLKLTNSQRVNPSSERDRKISESLLSAHNVRIKYPIVTDNPKAVWEKETKINNWSKKHAHIELPMGIKLEKTPKNVIAIVEEFYTDKRKFGSEMLTHLIKVGELVYYYLKTQMGITIDRMGAEIIAQDMATDAEKFGDAVEDGTNAKINLKRKAAGVLPFNAEAWAKLDRSQRMKVLRNLEIESNDLAYVYKLLMMPESVDALLNKTMPVIEGYNEQIARHLKAIQGIEAGITKWNELLGKLERKL